MRVTSVNLIKSGGTLMFPIKNASLTDKYILKNVEGLGPPELNMHISKALYAPNVYQGFEVLDRELVITLGLNPNYTLDERASDLRTDLYTALGSNGSGVGCNIEIVLEDRSLVTEGFVKKIDVSIFGKESVAQLVVQCKDGYLYDLMILEQSSLNPYVTIDYRGSAPTGFNVLITPNVNFSAFTLTNSSVFGGVEIMQLIPATDYLAGVAFYINTLGGKRAADILAGPTRTIVGDMTWDSKWPVLYPGINNISISDTDFDWTTGITYLPRYWGV